MPTNDRTNVHGRTVLAKINVVSYKIYDTTSEKCSGTAAVYSDKFRSSYSDNLPT